MQTRNRHAIATIFLSDKTLNFKKLFEIIPNKYKNYTLYQIKVKIL